ncbi:MAG: PhoU family transcriptional regulator [Thermoplasmata archaeon]|nr:MAG: PhoU family transcriptional regulator [Thermoplasmata archaeon]RLF36112.1 MAG: PhoU family transcriptional regulator [Thermoplasmata archaeon]
MVLEIKDKSELMVDLAYSSLLYDNRKIAEEVYDLENLIDNLYRELQEKAMEDAKNNILSIEDALALIRLGSCGEQIADAAQEIADIMLRDVELHPILKMSIRESDIVFTRVQVKPQSILCGKTLGELRLASETGMMIIAMRHKDRWLYGPNKNTRIDPGDILFAKGPEDGEKHLIELATGRSKEI